MPGMLNIQAHVDQYPRLNDPGRLYALNVDHIICTNVIGPRTIYVDNTATKEVDVYSIRIRAHDITLYAGLFQTLEEAEIEHNDLLCKIDTVLRRGSL